MEITGIECSHKECNTRTWLDSPDAEHWLTCVMTSPGEEFYAKVHYCPNHGAGLVKNTDLATEKLTTGQQKIINPAQVNEELARVLDDANRADLARVGGDAATEVEETPEVTDMPLPPFIPDVLGGGQGPQLPWGPATPANGEATMPTPLTGNVQQDMATQPMRRVQTGPRVGRKKTPRTTLRTADGIVKASGKVARGARDVRATLIGVLMLGASLAAMARGVR